jgi:DNA-directed RNA polymerase specialized sigma24 family protein
VDFDKINDSESLALAIEGMNLPPLPDENAPAAPAPEAAPSPAPAPAAPSDLGVRLALQRLELALERLKADDRIAFCLRYVEAMELSEVASAMGWSLASTKRYLARAKQRLWVLVEKDCVLAPYLESAGAIGKERR